MRIAMHCSPCEYAGKCGTAVMLAGDAVRYGLKVGKSRWIKLYGEQDIAIDSKNSANFLGVASRNASRDAPYFAR